MLKKHVNDIFLELKNIPESNETFKNCYLLGLYLAYSKLKDLGYKVDIVHGSAFYRVNETGNGLMSLDHNHQFYFKMGKQGKQQGNKIGGHFWLMIGESIIDIALLYPEKLKEHYLDLMGSDVGEMESNSYPFFTVGDTDQLDQLKQGKNGKSYIAIEYITVSQFTRHIGLPVFG